MRSPSGRFVTLFNGEVYNFQELRRQLEQHGFRFRGGSDTEIILAAFEQWGIRERRDALRRDVRDRGLGHGDAGSCRSFAIALEKSRCIVYSEPGLVTFGSELKALIAGPSFDSTIDREALASYLRYLYVPAPQCIFRRAMKVPAGPRADDWRSASVVAALASLTGLSRLSRVTASRIRSTASEAETIDHLDALLSDAVRCRMHADVPLGALLSGGIDSSTVVALMQEASARPVKTYTIGFYGGGVRRSPDMPRASPRTWAPITPSCASPATMRDRSSRGCRRSLTNRSPIRRSCRRCSCRSSRADR